MNRQLTANEVQALEALRREQEGISNVDASGSWASVYLDNAKPISWTPLTWRSILGSLSKKGLYKDDDGFAFGLVLMGE